MLGNGLDLYLHFISSQPFAFGVQADRILGSHDLSREADIQRTRRGSSGESSHSRLDDLLLLLVAMFLKYRDSAPTFLQSIQIPKYQVIQR